MDIPVYHLDFLNNRMLIAIIGILHMVITHSMAVGGIPLATFLEQKGYRTGDAGWDRLAFRIMTVFFITTTTLGVLTGVGLWISTSLVSPYAIGSLLRVFFWVWFAEWMIFLAEVVMIMTYYLSWERMQGARKAAHIKLGWALSLASLMTMVLVVSILGFMMDPGRWHSNRTLFSGVLNPIYLPQLAFRAPLAMIMAGAAALLLLLFFTGKKDPLRAQAVRLISIWILCWLPLCLAAGAWYAHVVPKSMLANIPVALLTQAFSAWSRTAFYALGGAVAIIGITAGFGAMFPKSLPRPLLVIPALLSILLMAHFERVREFIRKPYVIDGYLYSNGFRKAEYPLLNREGVLKYATYASVHVITPENRVAAGRDVFLLTCSRCHTVNGINSIRDNLRKLYGENEWKDSTISAYIGVVHNVRPFMPPFPGSPGERDALAAYFQSLQFDRDILEGVQTSGIPSSQP